MDKSIESIINEAFKSKKQQRYFYAKANDKSLSKKEREKWKKRAEEFSSETNFKKIPDEVKEKEEEVDEIIDDKGNIPRKKIPVTKASQGASKEITDKIVNTAHGGMSGHGSMHGTNFSLRYMSETDLSKSLGFEKTMGDDADIEDAEEYFKDELKVPEDEAKEKLASYGYDEDLPDDKVRLVENPGKYVRDYVESIINKRSKSEDLVNKEDLEEMDKEFSPVIKKQIQSLKKTLSRNDISIKDLVKILNKENE